MPALFYCPQMQPANTVNLYLKTGESLTYGTGQTLTYGEVRLSPVLRHKALRFGRGFSAIHERN